MRDQELRKDAILDEHEWRLRTRRRLQDAWRVIRWQLQQVEIDDMLEKRADEKANLRLYLELVETEEECSRLMSKRQGQEEFMVLVRAAAAARWLMEVIAEERTQKNADVLKRLADAIDMCNQRDWEWARARTSEEADPGGP